MSGNIASRLNRLEDKKSGSPKTMEIWVVGDDDMVRGPRGEVLTREAYALAHPDAINMDLRIGGPAVKDGVRSTMVVPRIVELE